MISQECKFALEKTLPIMVGFWFLGGGYGVYMHNLGFSFWYPLFMAAIIFAGSIEFVIGSLLLQSFQPLTVFILTALINSRHIFYGLSLLGKYAKMGKAKPLLIYGMCDETFSLNATLKIPEELNKKSVYLWITAFNYFSWVIGAGGGGLLGTIFNFDVPGLDFVMTALFIVLFTNQLKNRNTRLNALIGAVFAIVCLNLFTKDTFLLVTLVCLVLYFSVDYWRKERKQA
jgi:4-azaleucine resistance transporter AzlC